MEFLGLGSRLIRVLRSAGFSSLEELLDSSPKELSRVPGIGRQSAISIESAIAPFRTQEACDMLRQEKDVYRRIERYRSVIDALNRRISLLESSLQPRPGSIKRTSYPDRQKG